MKNTSLTRSTSYWLLLVLSLAATAIGGWLVWDSTTTMLTTILDGTATNVEVYVGQAWITSGAALLAAGIIGIFLSLVLTAAKTLVRASSPVLVEPIDWTAEVSDVSDDQPAESSSMDTEPDTEADAGSEAEPEPESQNGSSGSTATATNSSVR